MSAHTHPPLAQSHFASGLIGFTPSSQTRKRPGNEKGGICAPADLPLRQSSFPSGMRDLPRPLSADGVGFETIRY